MINFQSTAKLLEIVNQFKNNVRSTERYENSPTAK